VLFARGAGAYDDELHRIFSAPQWSAMSTSLPSDPLAADVRGKVLYIEDVDVNFAVVEAGLAGYAGVQLIRASTGVEGVRLVRSEHPDFVLLDMHLPDISGLAVVRLLNEEIAARRLRVTILTGDEFTMDVIKAMSLGAFEYWVKPVDIEVLKAGVRRALTGKRPDPARTLTPH
jgi:DNA-binding response OmpR family regulator